MMCALRVRLPFVTAFFRKFVYLVGFSVTISAASMNACSHCSKFQDSPLSLIWAMFNVLHLVVQVRQQQQSVGNPVEVLLDELVLPNGLQLMQELSHVRRDRT